MRNISGVLNYSSTAYTFVVPAASTINLDLDLTDCEDAKLAVEVTYAATHASTTGCTLNIFDGYGPQQLQAFPQFTPCWLGSAGSTSTATHGTTNANIIYVNNSTAVTLTTMTTNQSSTITKRTSFYFSDVVTRNTRWQELQFTNTDVTNAATIKIYIEI